MKRNLEKENQIQQMHENNIIQLKLLEKEMKNTCNQLEELEKEALDSLNKTKHMNMKMIGKDPYNYSNYNVGVNKKKNKKIKQINKSMDDVNGIEEILNGEEDANPNKSFLMKKNRVMSPTNNNQKLKLNLNEKNKSKTKYGSSMSINSFPKTNKSQSTKKNYS